MQFLFVQSGFPLELPLPRFVTSPQLFFRSGIPHHRGSARTFTAVRISRRSYNDEAPKPFRFRGFIYPLSRRSPQGRRRMAAIYSRSSRSERRPRRSCVAAETGRGTAFALGFPIGGSLRCPCSIGNDIHTACGRYPALPDDIHACGVDDIYEPGLANDEAPDSFESGASFTLAAIYSRGTCRPTTIDVLMFHFRVRNGTGWGHQAMTTRLLSYSLPRSSLLRNS